MTTFLTPQNHEPSGPGVECELVVPSGEALPEPFADQDLARRVEDAWAWLGKENARAQARLNPKSRATAMPVGGGYAVFMGAGSPLSQAQGLGMYGPVAEVEIERMETFYRERGSPIHLEVTSLADPTLLGLLSRRGYETLEQTHVLVRAIQPVESFGAGPSTSTLADGWSAQEGTTAGPRVTLIRPGEVAAWAQAVLRCFFPAPAEIPAPLFEGAIAMGSIPTVSCWLARVDGQIAGGGALAIRDGLALICGDGTLPTFRSQGVQTALLRARLARAQEAGCGLAVICTQPGSGSQRNAQRQGFHVVYARTLIGRE
jgi:GNAT superfamily N-acetyltransferase